MDLPPSRQSQVTQQVSKVAKSEEKEQKKQLLGCAALTTVFAYGLKFHNI